jgi:hypothetical protein
MTDEVATRSGQREALLDYEKLDGIADVTAREYARAEPYPHAVIDDFLDRDLARQLMKEFPPIDRSSWINWVHVNEFKFGRSDRTSFPPTIGRIVDELHSRPFIAWLERLTGIAGLLPAPPVGTRRLPEHPHRLHGPPAPAHLAPPPQFPPLPQRGLGGRLRGASRDVEPGHEPLRAQGRPRAEPRRDLRNRRRADVTRKSIAVYYFTQEGHPFAMRSTQYRARPGERWRALPIYLDMLALRLYDRGKRALNLDDRFASRVLNLLSRLRGR